MGRLDLEIARRVPAYNNRKDHRSVQRLKRLQTRRSAPAPPPQEPIFFSDARPSTKRVSQKSQSSYWDEKIAASAKQGDVVSFMEALEKVSTQHGLQLSSVLEQRDSRGNTYLHVAAWFGRYELVGLLTTDYGSPEWLQQENDEGDTAFHMAARAGHLAVMDLLLRRAGEKLSTDPKQLQNAKGNTLLHEALHHNHHHLVELLLHSSPYCSCYLNNQGKSPFYLSVEAGNQKTFDAMLKAVSWTSTHSDGLLDQSLMKGRSLLHAAVATNLHPSSFRSQLSPTLPHLFNLLLHPSSSRYWLTATRLHPSLIP